MADIKKYQNQKKAGTLLKDSSDTVSRYASQKRDEEYSKALDSAINELSSYVSGMSDMYKRHNDSLSDGRYDKNASSFAKEVSESATGYSNAKKKVLGILQNGNFNKDYVKRIQDYISSSSSNVTDMLNLSRHNADYWSQFKDEEDYNWNRYKSSYTEEAAAEGWKKYLADKAKHDSERSTITKLMGEDGLFPYNSEISTSGLFGASERQKAQNMSTAPNSDWTDEQRNQYGYIYAYSPDRAMEFAKSVNAQNASEARAKEEKVWSDSATKDANWIPATLVAAFDTATLQGLSDYLDTLTQYIFRGDATNYSRSLTQHEKTEANMSGISTSLNEKGVLPEWLPVIGSKGLGDLYQLGVSQAQSLIAAGITAGVGEGALALNAVFNPSTFALASNVANTMTTASSVANTYTLVSFFGSAGADGIKEAKERGADDGQAILYGTAVGLAEGFFEEFSIDKLVNIPDAETFKQWAKNILAQGGIEASEEFFTTVANTLSDAFIMADKSEVNTEIERLMREEGKSREEATKLAWMQAVDGALFDALGGFLSGAGNAMVISTGNALKQEYAFRTSEQYKTMLAKAQKDLTISGLTDSEVKTIAPMVARAALGKTLSNRNQNRIIKNDAYETAFVQALYDSESNINQQRNEYAGRQVFGVDRQALEKEQSPEAIAERVAQNYDLNRRLGDATIREGESVFDYANRISAREDTASKIRNRSVTNVGMFNTEKALADKMPNLVEKKFGIDGKTLDTKVSETGKTTVASTGKETKIRKIKSIENGRMNVELDDGTVVNVADVSFDTRDTAFVFEAIKRAGYTVETANSILASYNASKGVDAQKFLLGMDEMYHYGKTGIDFDDINNVSFSSELTDTQKRFAYDLGVNDADRDVARAQNGLKNRTVAGNKGGQLIVEKSAQDGYTDIQKSSVKFIESFAKNVLHTDIHLFADDAQGRLQEAIGGREVGDKAPNGFFDPETGAIWININAGNSREGTMAWTFAHELTHFVKEFSPAKFKLLADAVMAEYKLNNADVRGLIEAKRKNALAHGVNLSYEGAYEDVVCDTMQKMFTDYDAATKILDRVKAKDKGLWEKIKAKFIELYAKLRGEYDKYVLGTPEAQYTNQDSFMESMERLSEYFADAVSDASENFAQILESVPTETTEVTNPSNMVYYSYASLAEACGFDAYEDSETGTRYWRFKGMDKAVTEVTPYMIQNSPLGAMIAYARDSKYIKKSDYDKQIQMFVDIGNMSIAQQDFAQAMQLVGSAVFTAMKANADKQYGTTYDFPSICTKTQAVIDAMSAKMVHLGRGLSKAEIEKLYNKVWHDGNPVPCPECYVFSRWVGIGGLLDNIASYQNKYSKMTMQDVESEYRKLYKEIDAFATENGLSFSKERGKLSSKYTKEYQNLSSAIATADEAGDYVSQKDRDNLKKIESKMETVKAMTWIDTVYFANESHTKVNENYIVPNNVLFDLNKGEEFASKYREAWAFRTTQGAGYGKAITPYAKAVLGEGVRVTNNTTKTIKEKQNRADYSKRVSNAFLGSYGELNKDANKMLETARKKQLAQAFIGGQRFQSTSDARYENVTDYLIAAVEMQAMHGMVQVYTKVSGAVPAFADWGFSINQSLMPLNSGIKDGKIADTSTGGMAPSVAFKNREKYESAGTITIGVNDKHIRMMFNDVMRDFIIPYHASGGDKTLIAEFRRIQDASIGKGTSVQSTDYSKEQSEKIIPNSLLSELGYTDEEIKDVVKFREHRLAILTGKGKVDMDYIRAEGNEILAKIYDEFHGGRWDGVRIARGKCETQIYPNEYWDRSVSYDESGKITEDYLEYCRRLGMLHKFSGKGIMFNKKTQSHEFIVLTGYDENGIKVNLTDLAYIDGDQSKGVEQFFWKVLTDRRMYGNDGKYLEQKFVTLGSADASIAKTFAKDNEGSAREYNKAISDKTVDDIINDRDILTEYDLKGEVKPPQKFKLQDRSYFADESYIELADENPILDAVRETILNAHGNTSSGKYLFNVYENQPKYDYVVRLQNGDKTAANDVKELLSKIYIPEVIEDLRWFLTGFREYNWGKDYSLITESFKNDHRKGINKFRSLCDERIEELKDVGGTVINIKNNTELTVDEVHNLFNRLNTFKDVQYLADKIFNLASKLNLAVVVTDKGTTKEYGGTSINQGYYKGNRSLETGRTGLIVYRTNALNSKTFTDQRKADILLHEMIHAVTVYAYHDRNMLNSRYSDGRFNDALDVLDNVFRKMKYADAGKELLKKYGMNSQLEFIAEILTPDFRQAIIDNGNETQTKLYITGLFAMANMLGFSNDSDTIGATVAILEHFVDNFNSYEYDKFTSQRLYKTTSSDVKYSDRNPAPTFYSQMGKAIDDIKMDKVGSASLINYLKGRGVKDEEIKWSGIETFLEGKKSVTKKELQEFVAGSMLDIEEERLGAGAKKTEVAKEYSKKAREAKKKKKWGASVTKTTLDNDYQVWQFSIPKGMKESVLYEGQPLYSDRNEHEGLSDDQTVTSKDTSVPQVARTFTEFDFKPTDRVLDFGGGQYDIAKNAFEAIYPGIKIEVVDKFNRTKEHNERIYKEFEAHPADAVTVNNVLNTIDGQKARLSVVRDSKKYLKKDGVAYFLMYNASGDKEGTEGRISKKAKVAEDSSWQNNKPAKFYEPEIKAYYKYTKFIAPDYIVASDNKDVLDSIKKSPAKVATERKAIAKPYTQDASLKQSMRDAKYSLRTLSDGKIFSDRSENSTDNRTLLANALETVAQNDKERLAIKGYKAQIDILNKQQEKLAEVRKKIVDISFKKGADRSKLPELKKQANTLAEAINRKDKQLLQLEANASLKAVLERERAKAYKRAKEDSKESLQFRRERSEMSAMRTKIKVIAESFRKSLAGTNGNKFIPAQLAQPIIDICNAIDWTGRAYYKPGTNEIDIERTREEYDFSKEDSKAVQKYQTARQALSDLKLAYDSLKTDNNYDFSSEFDEEFSSMIGQLVETIGDTPLREMSYNQLNDVYSLLHDISYMIEDATKQIGEDEKITNYEAGQEIIGNMEDVKSLGLTTNALETFFREVTLNPMRAVLEMSGFNPNARLVKLFDAINKGRRKADTFRMESNKQFDELRQEDVKAYNDAVENKHDFGLVDINGNKAEITKMQAMFAVLTARRESANNNRKHLESPVLFPDVKYELKGKYQKALDNGVQVYITPEAVNKILAGLTEWDKRYLALAEKFFNTDSKNAINETMMIVKHRVVAGEKAYVPYIVNDEYVQKESENVKFDKSILNEGMLKTVVDNASQQLIMQNLNSVISKHIDKVAKVYGLAVPVRNFNKAFNVKQTIEDGGKPVKTAISETWGRKGTDLIDQAVADIQSPRRSQNSTIVSDWLAGVKGTFVVSTLASNLSVWMKQAASYPTAGVYLDAKYLYNPNALSVFGYNKKRAEDLFNEIDAHTSQHWIRRIGLSSQELGEINQSRGWANRLNNALGNFSPMNWIQAMDVKTTAALWVACKNQVEGTTNYEVGSEEYWNAVTKLYDKVIEGTQPMYDSLHRAEITKDTNLKNIILFQTQPIQNSGILREGAMELKMAKRQYGKNSAEAKTAQTKFVKAVASQFASHLLFTAMTLLSSALLHRMSPWDDDNKEVTAESIAENFGIKFAENYFGAIVPIFGNYATSIVEAFVARANGRTSYDVFSDATVDKVNGTIDKLLALTNPSFKSIKDALVEVSTYFGIPAGNFSKLIEGAILHIEDIVNGEFLSFNAGVDRSNKQNANIMYDAIVNGDSAKYNKYYAQFEDDDKAISAMRGVIKDHYVSGDIDADTAMEYLVNYGGMTESEAYWQTDKWNYSSENGTSEGYAKFDDWYTAVETGKGIKDTIKHYTDNGVSTQTLASQITSHFKPIYVNMTKSERASIKGYLLNAYALLGYNRADKSKDIDNWVK